MQKKGWWSEICFCNYLCKNHMYRNKKKIHVVARLDNIYQQTAESS